jgi:hypothetical protein
MAIVKAADQSRCEAILNRTLPTENPKSTPSQGEEHRGVTSANEA